MSTATADRIKIHTNVYTPKAYDILTRLWVYRINQKNGLRCQPIQKRSNYGLVTIETEPDGEIIWNISTENSTINGLNYQYHGGSFSFNRSSYYRIQRNKIKIREWIANELKKTTIEAIATHYSMNNNFYNNSVAIEYANKLWEDRTAENVIYSFSIPYNNFRGNSSCKNIVEDNITIAEVHCLYDIMMNKKRLYKNFSKNIIDKVRGEKHDPIKVEAEIIRREELMKLKNEFEETKNKLRYEQNEKISKVEEEIRIFYSAIIKELENKYNDNCKAVEKTFKDMLTFN